MKKIQEIMQNEHIDKLINKYFVIVLSIAVILFGAFYNYGLRMALTSFTNTLTTIITLQEFIHWFVLSSSACFSP